MRAAFLNSSQDEAVARKIEQDLQSGAIDLLYIAPERLTSARFLNLLRGVSRKHRFWLKTLSEPGNARKLSIINMKLDSLNDFI